MSLGLALLPATNVWPARAFLANFPGKCQPHLRLIALGFQPQTPPLGLGACLVESGPSLASRKSILSVMSDVADLVLVHSGTLLPPKPIIPRDMRPMSHRSP